MKTIPKFAAAILLAGITSFTAVSAVAFYGVPQSDDEIREAYQDVVARFNQIAKDLTE